MTRLTAAIGDIHGRFDLMAPLVAELEALGADGDVGIDIVFLGDYVDRGPDSRQVIERLIAGPALPTTRFIPLSGNHDSTMVGAVRSGAPEDLKFWYQIGGVATMQSYGAVDRDGLLHPETLVPAAHLSFLAGLQLHHETETCIFVHAGLAPGVALERQHPEVLQWIRKGFLDSSYDFGRLVVHGDTIAPVPDLWPTRLGLDSGAFQTGKLSAGVFSDEGLEFLLQAIAVPFTDDVIFERQEHRSASPVPVPEDYELRTSSHTPTSMRLVKPLREEENAVKRTDRQRRCGHDNESKGADLR